MRSARTTTSGSSPSSPPSPLSCSRRATTSGQRLLRNKLDNFRYFLKLVVVAIQEKKTIMIDDQYLEGSVRSAQPNCPLCTIWGTLQHVWGHRYDGYNLIVIIYGQNRSNFPVWACSGGVQQGAQGGAWLRRIPGDKDGHFWMWALTLETKKWVVLAS